MPTDDEMELRVVKWQCQRIANLKTNPRAESRASDTRAFEMLLLEIHAYKGRFRIFRRQPLGDLARSAPDIEHRSVSDRVTVEDRLLLWPNRLCLRGEIAHHRLIGHFSAL